MGSADARKKSVTSGLVQWATRTSIGHGGGNRCQDETCDLGAVGITKFV